MAAGPRTIALEFLQDVAKMRHALGYAPGCDLFEHDDWRALSDAFTSATETLQRILGYAPAGRVEEVRTLMDTYLGADPKASWAEAFAHARTERAQTPEEAERERKALERAHMYLQAV